MRAMLLAMMALLVLPSAMAAVPEGCTREDEVSVCVLDERSVAGSCETSGSETGVTLVSAGHDSLGGAMLFGMDFCGAERSSNGNVTMDVKAIYVVAGVPLAQTGVGVLWLSIDRTHPSGDSNECTFLVMAWSPVAERYESPGCVAGAPPRVPWGQLLP